ncbi:MAG: hypothetical protein LBI04_11420 [Treponema sp.]|jgi:hypothetical protein|nr:hypothetical protein [Treponema sp.]
MEKNTKLDERINMARTAGACKNYTMTRFKNYLLELGLTKYEKSILPMQTKKESPKESSYTERKIIPFPGVKLTESDRLQDELDDFLREMGYVE